MVDEILEFIALRIQKLRYERNVSARDMSLTIGQNEKYVTKIEAKQSKPSIVGLIYVCEYFGITLSEFFDEEVEHPLREKELLSVTRRLDGEAYGYLIGIAKKLNDGKK